MTCGDDHKHLPSGATEKMAEPSTGKSGPTTRKERKRKAQEENGYANDEPKSIRELQKRNRLVRK